MTRSNRTKGQNEVLVMRVLDRLAAGHHMKEVAVEYRLPMNTLRKLIFRYRVRHGFKSTYQMLAAYVVVRHKRKRDRDAD